MGVRAQARMIRGCLALSLVVALVAASPVVEVEVEERGLISDIAVGMLVGKIQEMLGITTTPKPGILGLGILPIGPDGTTPAPTEEEKLGLLQTLFGLLFPSATTTTPAPTTTKCGGLLGGGLLCPSADTTTTAAPATTTVTTAAAGETTTKCGGLLGGGLLC